MDEKRQTDESRVPASFLSCKPVIHLAVELAGRKQHTAGIDWHPQPQAPAIKFPASKEEAASYFIGIPAGAQ